MLLAAITKDVQLLLRDRAALFRLLALPIAFIVLFGSAFNAKDDRAGKPRAVAVWRDPTAVRATAVVDAIGQSGAFAVVPADSADAVRSMVASEKLAVGLVFPAEFDPTQHHLAELVIDEGASMEIRGPIEGALAGITAQALSGAGPRLAVFEARTPPGIKKPLDGLTAFQITVPGNSVLFGFFIALTCALSFAEERRSGTWRRLLAAPVPRWKLLIAKLVPFIAIGMLQLGFLFGLGVVAFGMKVGGSVPALVVLTLAVVTCATSLGLLLASLSATEKQISSLGSVVILVMGLLGGCMLPRAIMPAAMQQLGLFVPHGWALDGYYTLLVRDGAGFADVAKQIGAIFGFAAVFAFAGIRRFRFER